LTVGLKIIIRGSTVRVVATITEFDGVTLTDPDVGTTTVTFYDAANVNRGIGTLIHDGLGIWHCDYVIPAQGIAGEWHVDWYVEKGGEPTIGRAYFRVIA
jgi:hypothetical protein